MQKFSHSPTLWAGLIASALILAGCGSSTPETSNTTGTVSTFLSDPPTCAAPAGPFLNVWVTITKVRAHISGNANGDSDGWVDLVNLEDTPRQIDLLSLAPDPGSPPVVCLLNQLGQTTGLPPGNYQQIRIHLLANDASDSNVTPSNNCSGVGVNNCVQHTTTGLQPLLLSSQDETGIKIPPGRIASGAIQLVAGQSADINIDFDACSSIVFQGPNAFRLKPTLHAGEVSINQSENAINGRVVVNGTTDPIANAIVLLEQPDTAEPTLLRVARSGVTGSNGQFIFCPLPDGNYHVVVAAAVVDSGTLLTTTYNATIAFDVPVGTDLGDIPLVPEEPLTPGGSTDPATLMAEVTTDGAAGVPATVSPLQEVTLNSNTFRVTVPVFGGTSQPPNFLSATDTCSGGAPFCFTYELMVPASNPSFGVFDAGGFTYSVPAVPPVPYFVNAQSAACTTTGSATTAASVNVEPGATANPATLAITGCTAP